MTGLLSEEQASKKVGGVVLTVSQRCLKSHVGFPDPLRFLLVVDCVQVVLSYFGRYGPIDSIVIVAGRQWRCGGPRRLC